MTFKRVLIIGAITLGAVALALRVPPIRNLIVPAGL